MPRIAPSNTGRTPMERLMGHAPHILAPWTKLEDAFFASRTFSPALLEQVRRTLALGTGCRYCQAKAGPPDRSHADSRTAAAVELAEHFARDHRGIDETVLARARDHFTDAELCDHVHGLYVGGRHVRCGARDRAVAFIPITRRGRVTGYANGYRLSVPSTNDR